MAQTTQANPENAELPPAELESQIDSLLAEVESVTSAPAPAPAEPEVSRDAPTPEEAELKEIEDVRASEATDLAVDEAVSAAEAMDRVQDDLAKAVEAQSAPVSAPAPAPARSAPAAKDDADAMAEAIAAQAAALASEPAPSASPVIPEPGPSAPAEIAADAPAGASGAGPAPEAGASAPETVDQIDQQLAAMTQNLLETEPAADPAADPEQVAAAVDVSEPAGTPAAGPANAPSVAPAQVAAVAVVAATAVAGVAAGAAAKGALASAAAGAAPTGALPSEKAAKAVRGAGASLSRSVRSAWGRVEPALLKAAGKASSPLAKRPAMVRDTIGYVAVVTLFWGGVIWGYALFLRPSNAPAAQVAAFDFATSGLPQPEQIEAPADEHAAPKGEEAKDSHGGGGTDAKDPKKEGKPVLNAAEGDFVVNHAVAEREKAARDRAKAGAASKESKGGGGH